MLTAVRVGLTFSVLRGREEAQVCHIQHLERGDQVGLVHQARVRPLALPAGLHCFQHLDEELARSFCNGTKPPRSLSSREPSHRGLSPKVPSHQHHPTLTLLLPPPLPQHPRPVPGCISPSSHHLKDPKSPFSPPKSHPGPAGEPHRAGGRAAGR